MSSPRRAFRDPTKAQRILGHEAKTRLEEDLKRLSERIAPTIIAR
jgi:hypothetical protein